MEKGKIEVWGYVANFLYNTRPFLTSQEAFLSRCVTETIFFWENSRGWWDTNIQNKILPDIQNETRLLSRTLYEKKEQYEK